jgi:tetratricopeptide (TPR) repeat protein
MFGMRAAGLSRAAACLFATTVVGVGVFLSAGAGQETSQNAVPLRVIIVPTQAEAEQVLEELKIGADFSVMARLRSKDPTAADGGYMGEIRPGSLRPELAEALKGAGPGQLSAIAKLPAGFAILKVLQPNEIKDLDEAEQARQYYISQFESIRDDFELGGIGEADQAVSYYPKPANWFQDFKGACRIRDASWADAVKRAEEYLSPDVAARDRNRTAFDTLKMMEALGELHAYMGDVDKSLPIWEAAYAKAVTDLPQAVTYLDELLGIAYFRKSEMANDVYTKPGDKCIFPFPPGFKYANTTYSEKAIQRLLKVAQVKPEDLEVRWMLNLAYMTTGTYPAAVPKEYLLPPSAFESSESVGRFTDVAPEAGIDLFSTAGGLSVDDFDGDGLFDAITSSQDWCLPMHFYHNNGDGTFTDRAKEAGLSDQLGGLSNIQTDYNNDGCLDILVMRGGWEVPQRLSLLKNNCNGTFTDVTMKAGLGNIAISSQAAVWADVNNDGLLDLFVAGENQPNRLFLNNGDGTFKDISHSSGIDVVRRAKAAVAADYDRDGYMDFYVSTYQGDSELWHNNHDLTFTDVAKQAGVPASAHGFPAWFFDYDNCGWPDLFVASYYMSVEETMKTYLGLPHKANTLKLYKNLGNGAFRDVTEQVGLDKTFMPMGANFGDVDNDGYLDIYLGNGDPNFSSVLPHVLLRNKEGKSFVDITASSGTGELHKGHAVAFADMGNNGHEDILTVIGGAIRGERHMFRLFENPGNGNDWIRIHLVGVKCNRPAIGARIKVTVNNEGRGTRPIYRWVNSGGSFGASPFEQFFGLGPSARIESVEVEWPGNSSPPQTFRNVEKDQVIEIKEGAQNYTKLVRPKFRLGGANRAAAAGAR